MMLPVFIECIDDVMIYIYAYELVSMCAIMHIFIVEFLRIYTHIEMWLPNCIICNEDAICHMLCRPMGCYAI